METKFYTQPMKFETDTEERKKALIRNFSKKHLAEQVIAYSAANDLGHQRERALRTDITNLHAALAAAKTSLAEIEKVQQEMVARLERAYEAVVKAVLR